MEATTTTKTRWGAVTALLLTGVVAAMQVGKAGIALPLLQRDFNLSLFVAASAIGAYSVLGALFGLPAGFLSSKFDARRAMIAGLVLSALGSFAGAAAGGGGLLVASRVIEGCGFLATALSIPALLRRAAAPRDLDAIMPLWSAYLPMGSALMMLAGPAVLTFGWRELWLGNGAVTLAAAALIALVPLPTAPGANLGTRWGNAGAVLLSKGALLLGIAFGLYTFQVMAMSGLFPALLVDRVGLSVSEAGLIAALTLLANAVGNASAGLLLRAGLPVWGVVFGSFSFMALAALGIFSEHLPVAAIAVLASASLGVTGLIPGSIFAAASRLAPTAATLVVLLGLINQGSNIGTLAGPSSLGLLVQHFGWSSAWVLFAAVALCGIAAAIGLRAALRGAIR